jgi:hypothetical protein
MHINNSQNLQEDVGDGSVQSAVGDEGHARFPDPGKAKSTAGRKPVSGDNFASSRRCWLRLFNG